MHCPWNGTYPHRLDLRGFPCWNVRHLHDTCSFFS